MYYIYIITVILIIFVFLKIYEYLIELSIVKYIPDGETVDYAIIDDNIFSIEETKFFSQQIEKSPFIIDNPLNEGFKNSRGFLIEFTNNNLLEQFTKYNIEFLYDIFMKIKHPKCNRFLFNTLIIFPGKSTSEKSVEPHYDCTIQISEKQFPYRYYLPKCVNVIYVQLPNVFKGGQLELFTFHGLSKIPKQITPKLGRMVTFRGNLLHSVKSIYSNETVPRISLIFEQYQLPDTVKQSHIFSINKLNETI